MPRLLRSPYLAAFLLALAMRAGWGIFRLAATDAANQLEFPDEQQYWLMAESLVRGDGLRDELGFKATRMPLYPGALALFTERDRGVVYAKAWHWIVGALSAPLVAGLATSLFGQRAGWIAGLLAACDPFLIFFSSLVLTETPFITALVGLWWIAAVIARAAPDEPPLTRWIGLGALGALCIYLRESTIGLFVLLLLLLVACGRFHRRSLAGGTVAAAIVLLALVPWAARNATVTGEWKFLTYRSGISLYDGVRPEATGASDLGAIKQSLATIGMNEVQWNRYFLDESIRLIQADPGRIVRLGLVKLGRMWNVVPNVGEYRSPLVWSVSAAWTLPLFAAAAYGLVRLGMLGGWRLAALLMLPAAYLSALHSVFVGSVRYRLGAMPMIAVLAAFAIVELLGSNRRATPGVLGDDR